VTRISRSAVRAVIATAAVAIVALIAPAAASAHSFLIRSDPPAGARLASSPQLVSMFFSEPFIAASEHVSIRRLGGAQLQLQPADAKASEIRQSLPPHLRGIYVVSWRVLSDDGHISLGEFAFAVGSAAALPALASESSGRTDLSDVVANWLFFVGLALALGGLVSERLFWRQVPGAGVQQAPVMPALAAAALAQVWLLVLLAGAQRGGGFSAGLSWRAVNATIAIRPGALTIAVLVEVAVAAVIVAVPRARLFAVVPLIGAVIATSARGHSGTSGGWWALPADIVHLIAAALWVGALVHLVFVAARFRRRPAVVLTGVGRYSRLALPTVLVVLASGVLTAIPEFRSFGDLTGTSYGRMLLIKSALTATALLAALVSRLRALTDNPHPRISLLRRTTGTEAIAVLAVLAAASVLLNDAPPKRETAAAAAPALLGPPTLHARPSSSPNSPASWSSGSLPLRTSLGTGSLKLTADAVPPAGHAVDLFPRPCGDAALRSATGC
jgi:copper transport protein